jgi:cell filamentation protein
VFDPFGDYQTAGYLRNVEGLKDLEQVKVQEHLFFEMRMEAALEFLRSRKPILYEDFLRVHGILFGEFYPWAGTDRETLQVGRLVGKGERVQFEVSHLARRAVEWGLELGNDPAVMRARPGEVMGAFAWGHPFLDGNGRTMLLVHAELCYRASFAIDWAASDKDRYLEALTQELATPQGRHLDIYLRPLVREQRSRTNWVEHLKSAPGLDGRGEAAENVVYSAEDVDALRRYAQLKQRRGEAGPAVQIPPAALR